MPHSTHAVAIFDLQLSRAWLVCINHCRIHNQMHRQNLYSLEDMKGLTLEADGFAGVKKITKLSMAWWDRECLIYCIDKKDETWGYKDIRNTPANDITIDAQHLS